MNHEHRPGAGVPAFVGATLLLFIVLTAVMTYPQLLHLRDGVHDEGDPLLVTWIFAWVAHQLPFAPAHLFDANIFYPERHTLAFAETMLAPAIAVAPLHWLGVERILIYNLVFLAGFVLSGVATALLVRSLTGHAGGGIVSGLIFAFLPYRIDQYPHLQLQQTQWIPLSLWALHRLIRTGRVRDGVCLGVSVGGQILSCVYYGLFLLPYLAVVGGALLVALGVRPRWPTARVRGQTAMARDPRLGSGPDGKARAIALSVAAAIVGVAVLPIGIAYVHARQIVGERALQEVIAGSATWQSYLAAPAENVLYGKLFARFVQPERVLFPGFIATILAILALSPRRTTNVEPRTANDEPRTPNVEPRTTVAYALGLLFAFDISWGVHGFTFPLFHAYVLPFRSLRAPSRMGVMVGFSLAVLAGCTVARMATAVRSARARRLLPVAVGAFILLEYASRPVRMTLVPRGAPEIYADLLRDRGDSAPAILFEFPMTPDDDPTYMYYATFHWQLLVNGYSGFFPASYVEFLTQMASFPDARSLGAIKERGVGYVLVHGERLKKWRDNPVLLMRQLGDQKQLALVSRRPWQDGEISLYRVVYP